jgi:predicted amidohydrolase
MTETELQDWLRVGIIQTTVDADAAWSADVNMSSIEEERVVSEMQQHLASLALEVPKPDIILLPEVTVPLGFTGRLRRIASQMNCIIIAGLDFDPVSGSSPLAAQNRAAVIIPNRWGRDHSSRTTIRYVGKTYPSYEEEKNLNSHGYQFRRIPEIWVFEAGKFGRFGVVVCFDLLDLERVAMYRLHIQHLFVLAYNKDITTFDHAAEALARMVYCNIVICNTGTYGGSIAVSPYKQPERRLIYRHSGSKLSTSQTIHLPVKALYEAQTDTWPKGKEREFKALPPGAKAAIAHHVLRDDISGA